MPPRSLISCRATPRHKRSAGCDGRSLGSSRRSASQCLTSSYTKFSGASAARHCCAVTFGVFINTEDSAQHAQEISRQRVNVASYWLHPLWPGCSETDQQALSSVRSQQELSYRQQIACQPRTQYAEGLYRHKYYTVTLKTRLVTQGHWKRNHWIDHTRLCSSRVIWRWILLWPSNVG